MDAIEDMLKYYAGDDDHLRDELLCFQVLLQRAKALPEADLDTVLRRLRMLDPLLEEDPWVQEYGKKQKARGEADGEVRGVRQSIKMLVQMRFSQVA